MVSLSLEEVAKELTRFGLTNSQARAYVALFRLGTAPVSQIAQLSKIRREEIYRMMPKLEKLGLVEKVLGNPLRFKLIPPNESLSILLKHEKESADRKIAELTEKRRHLLKQLKYVKSKTIDEEEPSFVLISGKEQAFRKMGAMLQKAKKEISVASTEYDFRSGYTYIADVFRRVLRKGVKARIILQTDEVDALTVTALHEVEIFKDVVEVKHADNLTSHIVIVDNVEALVGTFLGPTGEKHIDLWTNNLGYIDTMLKFFDRIWQDAIDIRSRIDEISKKEPIGRTTKPIIDYISKKQKKKV